MLDLYRLAGPILRRLDPELAHALALKALEKGLVPRSAPPDEAILHLRLWGLEFPNPIGLAAGFDKDGRVPDAMLAQGFGFVEVGSVTPRPQPGNPRPRLFRLTEDRAVINRLGFNSEGHVAVAHRLSTRRRKGVVGVNLGANRDSADAVADYVAGVDAFAPLADFLVVNISSPNTPGLRALQGPEPLSELLAAIGRARAAAARRPPLLVKIAPDLTDEDKRDIARVCLERGIDGLVVGNTTVERPASLKSRHHDEAGGLSGPPLFAPSTRVLAEMRALTGGRIPLVGVGGVASGADAFAKIAAGASLVELYTALVYEGPGLVHRINRELAALHRARGFRGIAEAVGCGDAPVAASV